MISNLLLQLSDWNPQFFREVKGRLKPRNLGITVATSLLVQSVILLYLWAALPGSISTSNRYCTGKGGYGWHDCVLDAFGNPMINWSTWWSDLFLALSWLLPFVVLVAGVYMLIGDLAKEERRGTLNFIRLSPQASQSILIGKLFGVPLIPWLAVIIAIPLHLWSAISAGVPMAEVGSIYLVTVAACCFLYTGAVFYAFLGGAHGWLGAITVWFSYTVFFQLWQALRYDKAYLYFGPNYWYGLQISQSLGLAVTFAVVNFAIGTAWIWRAINRRFRNPHLTLVSKRQSYLMTFCFQIFTLGFVFREHPDWDYYRPIYDVMSLSVVNLFWFLLLIAALTPHRQALLDWARYRRDGESKTRKFWRKSMRADLVVGEKSPALVAIALNLLIPAAVFSPWILTWADARQQTLAYLSLLFTATFLLICAAIAQSILFWKSQKRSLFAAGVLGALIILPPIAMMTLGAYPKPESATAWLFSAFAFSTLEFASTTAIFFGLLSQLAVFTLLSARFTQQLRRAGESELKALMAQRTV